MAAGDNTCTGIRIVHESLDPVNIVKVKVEGDVPIARGEYIVLASGLATAATTSTRTDDSENFVGIALTANEGDEASAIQNEISVALVCQADLVFGTAPAASDYVGSGVSMLTAADHVYTFSVEATGADLIGHLAEDGDGSSTTRRVRIDSLSVCHGALTAGQGFWEVSEAES